MKYTFLALMVLVFVQCKNKTEMPISPIEESSVEQETSEANLEDSSDKADDNYVKQSNDDEMAEYIMNFLKNDYLKEELSTLEEIDRKFQFYKIDLNNDGKEEVFVNFLSPFFCGSGGCNVLLLSNEGKIITNFSVTRPPIYVEKTIVNGWRILLVRDRGQLKELKFDAGTYPSNPSVVDNAPYDAPSGNAEIMFDENFSKPKTYTY